MTSPIETDDITTTTTPPDPSGNGDSDTLDSGQGDRKIPREQRYRLERNSAREALTAAEARIQAFQTREVERLASELAQPSDLFGVGGVSLADLVGEAGEVDPDLVEEAVASLLEQRPGLAKRPRIGAYDSTQGMSNSGTKPSLSWNDLLKR